MMRPTFLLGMFTAVCWLATATLSHAQIELSPAEKEALGKRIWQNEAAGQVAGLTAWNRGEDFGSFGIGHFIWYPEGKRGPFQESFPELIRFLQRRGYEPPAFVLRARGCPWPNRAAFEQARNSPEMRELRDFLVKSIPGQTDFLIARFNAAVPKTLDAAPRGERRQIEQRLRAVGSTSRGAFALVDYVNFKGEGISPTERYRGEGWGLLQVLQAMSGRGNPVDDFGRAAGAVLTKRVENSPPERNERRWLEGWLNRVNRY